eukprot:m.89151 g.89151  ORF g.89151 m.89151 type:complete len:537 (+) comp9788_c0_seq1:592-2202(+)
MPPSSPITVHVAPDHAHIRRACLCGCGACPMGGFCVATPTDIPTPLHTYRHVFESLLCPDPPRTMTTRTSLTSLAIAGLVTSAAGVEWPRQSLLDNQCPTIVPGMTITCADGATVTPLPTSKCCEAEEHIFYNYPPRASGAKSSFTDLPSCESAACDGYCVFNGVTADGNTNCPITQRINNCKCDISPNNNNDISVYWKSCSASQVVAPHTNMVRDLELITDDDECCGVEDICSGDLPYCLDAECCSYCRGGPNQLDATYNDGDIHQCSTRINDKGCYQNNGVAGYTKSIFLKTCGQECPRPPKVSITALSAGSVDCVFDSLPASCAAVSNTCPASGAATVCTGDPAGICGVTRRSLDNCGARDQYYKTCEDSADRATICNPGPITTTTTPNAGGGGPGTLPPDDPDGGSSSAGMGGTSSASSGGSTGGSSSASASSSAGGSSSASASSSSSSSGGNKGSSNKGQGGSNKGGSNKGGGMGRMRRSSDGLRAAEPSAAVVGVAAVAVVVAVVGLAMVSRHREGRQYATVDSPDDEDC